MRYVYTGGAYRQFRGYVFANGLPTTVSDRATLEAIAKDPTFRAAEDAPPQDPDGCPKCGKVIKQGRYMHVKFCRGVK